MTFVKVFSNRISLPTAIPTGCLTRFHCLFCSTVTGTQLRFHSGTEGETRRASVSAAGLSFSHPRCSKQGSCIIKQSKTLCQTSHSLKGDKRARELVCPFFLEPEQILKPVVLWDLFMKSPRSQVFNIILKNNSCIFYIIKSTVFVQRMNLAEYFAYSKASNLTQTFFFQNEIFFGIIRKFRKGKIVCGRQWKIPQTHTQKLQSAGFASIDIYKFSRNF